MIDINSFFSNRNTVKKISSRDLLQENDYLSVVEAFSRTTYNSIYIIDYEKKGFDYVSSNPLFLCGHTPEEVKEMGYEFYFKHVPKKDIELLLKINTIGFDMYQNVPLEDRKEYTISYDFSIKTEGQNTILINQKLTPLFLNEEGKVWKAICIISLSPEQQSGNIKVYKNGDSAVLKYNLSKDYWETLQEIQLSDREKEIIQLSIRGYTINQIAEKIHLSSDTVKFHRKKLFDKLEVSNISEAIVYATNNMLL